MKAAAFGLAASLALGIPGAGLADDLKATEKFTATGVGFDLQGSYSNVTLTVSGPNRFQATAFSNSGAPALDLRQSGAVEDGLYRYQLTAATDDKVKVRTKLDNGRGGGDEVRRAATASGTFHVKDGAIVKVDPSAREEKQKRK